MCAIKTNPEPLHPNKLKIIFKDVYNPMLQAATFAWVMPSYVQGKHKGT